jgi:hypothetical protein
MNCQNARKDKDDMNEPAGGPVTGSQLMIMCLNQSIVKWFRLASWR